MGDHKIATTSGTRSPSEANVSPDSDASSIMLVIANIGSDNKVPDKIHIRRKAFAGLLKSEEPDIVLVQELKWTDKRDGENNWVIWKNIDTPKQYEHVRYNEHTEASVVFDKNKFTVKVPQGKEITNFIKKMEDKRKISESPPQERMCIVEIKSKNDPNAHYLFISWHGYYKKRSDEEKKKDLSNLFIFIQEISKQMELPFIIGGDFNLNEEKLRKRFEKPDGNMFLYYYEHLKHKKKVNVIDFYITSEHLLLDAVAPIDWKSVEDGKDATEMFNHDPVIAKLPPPKVGLKISATKGCHLSY